MSWPTMTDYQEAIQNPRLCFADHELQSGLPVIGLWNVPKAMSGSFAVVFQIDCNGRKYAVKCFTAYHPDQEERYAIISQHLKQTHLPYIVGFEFLRQGIKVRGQWYPILKMEWVDGDPLNSYIEKNLGNPQSIQGLAQKFLKLISDLRRCLIAHGDLQHGNILIVDGDFRLIDYDGMYVPGLDGMLSHELGHRNYQHPNRTEQDFGSYLDNFSAWVIYISLIAFIIEPNFWYRFDAGDEHLLFRREDFENPELSKILNTLEEIRDSNIQSLISLFRSHIYHQDLSLIPLLDETQFPPVPGIPVTTSATGQSIHLPTWVVDHIEVHPVHINQPFILERLFLIAFAIIGAFFAYTATSGLVAPIIAASAIGGELSILLLTFTIRFRSFPEVLRKFKLSSDLNNLRRDIKQIENIIKRLNDSKNRLNIEEGQKVTEITSKQREFAQREKMRLTESIVSYKAFYRISTRNGKS
jgi:serine/threonine protein kinase